MSDSCGFHFGTSSTSRVNFWILRLWGAAFRRIPLKLVKHILLVSIDKGSTRPDRLLIACQLRVGFTARINLPLAWLARPGEPHSGNNSPDRSPSREAAAGGGSTGCARQPRRGGCGSPPRRLVFKELEGFSELPSELWMGTW